MPPKRVWAPPYYGSMLLARWRRRCTICQRSHDEPALICQACLAQIPLKIAPVKISLSEHTHLPLYAISHYQYPVNALITRYKDHEDSEALMALIGLIHTLPPPKLCHPSTTVIIPIPTTAHRLQERGFYPVLSLAKHLAKHWRLPIWLGLKRRDGKLHQRGLDRQARLQNPKSDFYLAAKLPVQQVILFDDVATTGATLAAAAGVIKERHPTAKILAVCMAHGTAAFGLQKL